MAVSETFFLVVPLVTVIEGKLWQYVAQLQQGHAETFFCLFSFYFWGVSRGWEWDMMDWGFKLHSYAFMSLKGGSYKQRWNLFQTIDGWKIVLCTVCVYENSVVDLQMKSSTLIYRSWKVSLSTDGMHCLLNSVKGWKITSLKLLYRYSWNLIPRRMLWSLFPVHTLFIPFFPDESYPLHPILCRCILIWGFQICEQFKVAYIKWDERRIFFLLYFRWLYG